MTASSPVDGRRCANCGEPIRPKRPQDGIDGDWGWTHVSGGLMCDNSYYDETTDQWHDATYASVGGDGWG